VSLWLARLLRRSLCWVIFSVWLRTLQALLLPWELCGSQTLLLLTGFDPRAAVSSWQSQREQGRGQCFLVTAEKFGPEPAAPPGSHPREGRSGCFTAFYRGCPEGGFPPERRQAS